MNQDDLKQFVYNHVMDMMKKDAELLERFGMSHTFVENAQKCLKYIKCLACNDTSRVVLISDGYLYGVYYDEYTCGLCNGGKTDFIRRHNRLSDAVDKTTKRQIPCHEHNARYNTYRPVVEMAKLYEDKYKLADDIKIETDNKLVELKERETRIALAEKRLQLERDALNMEKIPRWTTQKFDHVERQIREINVKVDIQNLVEDIMKCVAIAAGNLAAIPSLVSGLDASLNLCWSNSKQRSYYSDILDDETKNNKVYVRFDYRKMTEDDKADVKAFRFFWEDKKEYIHVSYLVLKPANAAAECKCVEMMNSDFETIQREMKR